MNRRYKLVVEYDGTNFSGWQKQNDARTIQGDLLKVASRLFDGVVDLQGCGRTDAGVHGLNYVAHLEVRNLIEPTPAEAIAMYNEALPKDIAIRVLELAEPRYHARHNCLARSYIYQLSRRKSAFGKRYSWWVGDDLDLVKMEAAKEVMTGHRDYRAFAEKPELRKSTKVEVLRTDFIEKGNFLIFRVIGSHFLWHMVRRMVGILVAVGRGELTVGEVEKLFSGESKLPHSHTAPPSGLFFDKAYYKRQELEFDLNQGALVEVSSLF